ncbi:MarR family winged helix-turn-helix transcriptional regulator [Hellea sp.]|nr:MarR family winged helix-turn-helix transcriptional regulator [Hellea sp.]
MSMINKPEDSLPYHIRAAFRGFETALSRFLATKDLPLSQFYILRLQWDEDGNGQNDLAERACMSESVASQVIQKMEKSGLVTRKAVPGDARKRRIFLTKKGRNLRDEIMSEGIQISKEHAPDISREQMITTISTLIKVKDAFDAYNAEG